MYALQHKHADTSADISYKALTQDKVLKSLNTTYKQTEVTFVAQGAKCNGI